MIAASAIGLFVIPMLYVTFQTIRERSSARFQRLEPHPAPLPSPTPRAEED
jgi:HAE1 family hydrophobic/amphiphilic exporter-1